MRAALLLLAGLLTPEVAAAQPDFSHLKVRIGQTVYVTDLTTGARVTGPLAALAPDFSVNASMRP